ncbi:hypothetical protein AAG906_001942 [Vitis piasezkii]
MRLWAFKPVVGWVNHQYVLLHFRVIFHSIIACAWYNTSFPGNISKSTSEIDRTKESLS